jgi:parallel beta-helix repeat protein
VDITQGRLDLEGCEISSQSFACVVIRDGADPRLRRNKIHDGKQGGVLVFDSGLGTLEDNDITGNARSGVEVTGGNPTVRGNRINRNGYTAVYVHDGGQSVVEDNDLTGNKQGAWDIAADCKANVTRARDKE